ncbi:hypothetical protein C8R47DRAFT_1226521 [Mycena vitilis]|nr:hypothetical protein C8R47DRAFT_1226521 [Mycena vitilis]
MSSVEMSADNFSASGDKRRSTKRRNEFLAKGLCFKCEEPGHLARNCPNVHTISSEKKGQPPGISTHAANIVTSSASRDALWESTEVLESMHIGAARLGNFAFEVAEGGEEPLETFGSEFFDCMALEQFFDEGYSSPGCFRVTEQDAETLYVLDWGWNMAALLPKDYLRDPSRDLFAWFEVSVRIVDEDEPFEVLGSNDYEALPVDA